MKRTSGTTTHRPAKEPPAQPPRPRRLWPRWARRTLLVLVIGLLVAHHLWGRSTERKLDEQIRAYAADGQPIYPADLNDPPLPDDQNAVPDLIAAAALLRRDVVEWHTYHQLNPGPPLTDVQAMVVTKVIESNRDVLRMLDAALAKPAARWDLKFASPVLRVEPQQLTESMHLASLLRAAALLAHHDRDEPEAVRRSGPLLTLARFVDRQPSPAAHVSAMAIAVTAAKTASEIAPDLRVASPAAPMIRRLIEQFLDERAARDGQLRTLRTLRVLFWDTAKSVAAGRRDLLARPGGPSAIGGGWIGSYGAKPLMMWDARVLVRYATAVTNAARSSEDWPAFLAAAPPEPAVLFAYPRLHFLAVSLLPDVRWYLRGHYRAATETRLAAIALAAGWYAAEHDGKLPAKLDDLKPAYLPYLPHDPMAPGGKQLRLARSEATGKTVIYSVGDDALDDGGSTVTAAGAKAGPWERRDFVVRLSRPAPTTAPAPVKR